MTSNLQAVREAVIGRQLEARDKKEDHKKYEFHNVDILSTGTQIILPVGMSKLAALEAIQKKMQQDEEIVNFSEEIEAHPIEGAVALMEVLKQIYGWATPMPTQGFFGPQPPTMLNVEVGYGVYTQVIWGQCAVPGIEGMIATGATRKNGRLIFRLVAKVKQKHKEEISTIAQAVREHVRLHSIYKGKAIRLRTDEDGDIQTEEAPQFLDTSKTDQQMLIFSDEVKTQVQTHIFTPIEKTEVLRENNIKLKRTVLLEGPFGTGKTLTAHVAAAKAEQNGWTFIYLDRVVALKEALIFARGYAPAIIFAEDVDRVVSGGRTTAVDDILNTIDGVDSKHDQTMVILTSNDVKSIEKAMIRPGRLDAVIHVGPPDAAAAERLIRAYAGELLPAGEDLTEAAEEIQGQIPATIAEVVSRSKLYAISKMQPGDVLKLSGSDIAHSARGIKPHLALLQEDEDEIGVHEGLGLALSEVLEDQMKTLFADNFKKIEEIHDQVH